MDNKHRFLIAAFCLLIPMLTFGAYLRASQQIADAPIMPLDDSYIHFQYARSIAEGRPSVYNPGQAPTSGATSLLYPYLLAIGYALGFKGLTLGMWAMWLGVIFLAWSMAALVFIARKIGLPLWVGLLTATLFAVNGSTAWHFMSGMETGLAIAATLTVFAALLTDRLRPIALSAALLALIRPELSMMALVIVLGYALHHTLSKRPRANLRLFALPLAAIALQPLLNWLVTGELSASGNQAKSILGVIPFDWSIALERISDNFFRLWREWLTDGAYLPALVPPFALIGFAALLVNRRGRWMAFTLALAFPVIAGAISTLDTAFWHFKRYQMPLMALFFPLALIGANALWRMIAARQRLAYWRWPRGIAAFSIAIIAFSVATNAREFLRLYRVNIENITAQPLPMARWLNANTDADALIAVHDVGMMRYVGERTTLDMVGLTTPDAADYWRNGPGAVGEYLLRERPDFIAAYTTARGLNYLVATPLYGTLEQGYTATYNPADNVALGAEFQGIYRVDWQTLDTDGRNTPHQASILSYLGALVAEINVADLASESAAHYRWSSDPSLPGFATEFYTFRMIAGDQADCTLSDGGRRLTDWESFTIDNPHADLVLVTRLHPAVSGTLTVFVNDAPIATREIIEQPGQWLEVATAIPAVDSETLTVRIATDTLYMPYRHWLYTANPVSVSDAPALASYQNGAIQLTDAELRVLNNQLVVTLTWRTDGTATGNYKVFVHVYGDDFNTEPLAQQDAYPGAGTLPPGNWLQGMISDQIMVDLEDLEAGAYHIAIGFYDPQSSERLSPSTTLDVWTIDTDRLFVGEIEFK